MHEISLVYIDMKTHAVKYFYLNFCLSHQLHSISGNFEAIEIWVGNYSAANHITNVNNKCPSFQSLRFKLSVLHSVATNIECPILSDE